MNREARIEWLRHVDCFARLDESVLGDLAETMVQREFSPGGWLCQEGEAGDCMFLIEKGTVEVIKQSPDDDKRVLVGELEEGQVAGELSLISDIPRSAGLRAKGPVKAWELSRQVFQDMLGHNCGLAKGLLAGISQHLRRETSVVAQLLARGLDPRFRVTFYDSKPYTEAAFDACNQYGYNIQYQPVRLTINTVSLASGCKVVCTFVNDELSRDVLTELRDLGVEMVALRCAGYNNVDLEAAADVGMVVTRVPAYSPYAVAEHAVALMMALNRKTHRAFNRVREANFSINGLVGFDVHGKTVGIVGAGKIGQCLLRILNGFGCQLLAHDKYPSPALTDELGVTFVELDDLLARSDIISLHAPLLPETRHMIDAAATAKMKRGVMLINTSRGALIDTAALIDGLKTGQIGTAGLDVYEEESEYFFEDCSDEVLTDDVLARLMTFNNVIVTSHQAFLTHEALRNIAETTITTIRAFEQGKRGDALPNQVSTAR